MGNNILKSILDKYAVVGKTYKNKTSGELVGVLDVNVNHDVVSGNRISFITFKLGDYMFPRGFEEMESGKFFDFHEKTTPTEKVTVRNENDVLLVYGKKYTHKKDDTKETVTFLMMVEMGLAEFNLRGERVSLPTSEIYELEANELSDASLVEPVREESGEKPSSSSKDVTWSDLKEQMTSLTAEDKMRIKLVKDIVIARKEKSWTMTELAVRSGVSLSYIEDLELLETELGLAELIKLAIALDLEVKVG